MYKTTDGGRTWFNLLGRLYPYLMVDPQHPDIVYLSTRSGHGKMLRTTDGGKTFEELGKGRFLALHPDKHDTIFAERPDGFYISHDRAKSFEKISDQADLGDFFISNIDPDLMFSARGDEGLYKSTDGGHHWSKLDLELNGMTRFTGLPDGSIWLANPATGLVHTVDQGKTWQPIWNTMGDMAPDPWNNHALYMITRGGIWWVHPKQVTRKEIIVTPAEAAQSDQARNPEPPAKTVKVTGPFLVDGSNTTYKLDRDITLDGLDRNRSLALFNRGLKNIVIDGGGHTVQLGGASVFFGDDAENVTIRNFHFVAPRRKTPRAVHRPIRRSST